MHPEAVMGSPELSTGQETSDHVGQLVRRWRSIPAFSVSLHLCRDVRVYSRVFSLPSIVLMDVTADVVNEHVVY